MDERRRPEGRRDRRTDGDDGDDETRRDGRTNDDDRTDDNDRTDDGTDERTEGDDGDDDETDTTGWARRSGRTIYIVPKFRIQHWDQYSNVKQIDHKTTFLYTHIHFPPASHHKQDGCRRER